MKKIILISLLYSPIVFSSEMDQALKQTQKAILKTAPVKEMTDRLADKAELMIENLNIPEWSIASVGVIVKIANSKEINSKDLAPKLKMELGTAEIKPTIRYQLDSGRISGMVDLRLDF